LNLFFNSTSGRLNKILIDQGANNFIQKVNDVTDQINSVFEFSDWTIQKNDAVLT